MKTIDILGIIDQLEMQITNTKKVPLSRRGMVDMDSMLALILELKRSLPKEVGDAVKTLRQRDAILSEAIKEANRITEQAQRDADLKIRETSIIKGAEIQATRIIMEAEEKTRRLLQEAERQATERVAGADKYAANVLYQLEEQLNGLLSTARRGIESLERNQDTDE